MEIKGGTLIMLRDGGSISISPTINQDSDSDIVELNLQILIPQNLIAKGAIEEPFE